MIDDAVSALSQPRRKPFLAGLRAAVPLAVPAVPIGILLGVAIRDSDVISNLAGWSASWMLLAGAAQFAAIDLLDQGAGVVAVVAAIFMINARHLMYSAAMSARFKDAPMWFKLVGSYLLIDQSFALNGDHAPGDLEEQSVQYRSWYYIGTAAPMVAVWVSTVTVGIFVGELLPPQWEIDFAIPLMFLGLLVISTANIPGVVAAVIGGTVAVVGRDWPSGSGLLAGAVLGVLAAGLLDLALEYRQSPDDLELAPGPGEPVEEATF